VTNDSRIQMLSNVFRSGHDSENVQRITEAAFEGKRVFLLIGFSS